MNSARWSSWVNYNKMIVMELTIAPGLAGPSIFGRTDISTSPSPIASEQDQDHSVILLLHMYANVRLRIMLPGNTYPSRNASNIWSSPSGTEEWCGHWMLTPNSDFDHTADHYRWLKYGYNSIPRDHTELILRIMEEQKNEGAAAWRTCRGRGVDVVMKNDRWLCNWFIL